MKQKLFLNEDDNVLVVPAQHEPAPAPQAPAAQEMQEPVMEPTPEVLSASNLISQMIKGEWDAIDLYNSVVATLVQDGNNEIIVDAIRDIVKEEYVHVGQLEKVLQFINEQASKIKEGEQEAEADVAKEEPVTVPVQVAAMPTEVSIS